MDAEGPVMRYLVSIAFGPVQDFIAAARRTSDLAAGSELLAGIVGAAAGVFPSYGDAGTSWGRIFPVDPSTGGANKILAVVDGDPRAAVEAAKASGQAHLTGIWTNLILGKALSADQKKVIDRVEAQRQVASFLEVYAAWVPLDAFTSFAAARNSVERLLAGRKALRTFAQTPGTDEGVPNSPLDPMRPSVVNPPGTLATPLELRTAPLWLKSSELLDGVSLLKRLLGRRPGEIPSTRDLAERSRTPGFGPGSDEFEPSFPYFGVLVADGDRMGARLNALSTPEEHRRFSVKLDEFAAEAREFIQETHDAFPVYLGGDDVLALVPVVEAVSCARTLSELFENHVGGATLSTGVAIVHYREPLSLALSRARHAERAAKRRRNRIAVAVHKRSGSPLLVDRDPADRGLTEWPKLFRSGGISSRLPYKLRELARRWPDDAAVDVLDAEARRIVARSQPSVSSGDALLRQIPPITDKHDLDDFVTLLLVSRALAGANE